MHGKALGQAHRPAGLRRRFQDDRSHLILWQPHELGGDLDLAFDVIRQPLSRGNSLLKDRGSTRVTRRFRLSEDFLASIGLLLRRPLNPLNFRLRSARLRQQGCAQRSEAEALSLLLNAAQRNLIHGKPQCQGGAFLPRLRIEGRRPLSYVNKACLLPV